MRRPRLRLANEDPGRPGARPGGSKTALRGARWTGIGRRLLTASNASSQEARTWGLIGGASRRKNAAMERRMARVLIARGLVAGNGDYQDVAPSGAPSPSAYAGGKRNNYDAPASQRTGAVELCFAGCLKTRWRSLNRSFPRKRESQAA